MGSCSLGVPGPALLLLLVLPPPPLRARSLHPTVRGGSGDLHGPAQRDKGHRYHLHTHEKAPHHRRGPSHSAPRGHGEEEPGKPCHSEYDLYFILDKSGSVDNNWMDIYNLVEDLVNKFENPNVRISFVTYSTDGHTLLKLTSDKNKIRDGLAELQNIVPTGATHMQEGFIKVNEQIEEVNSGDKKFPSMIIALTDGTLMPEPYEETKIEAERSRQLGATIYSIGVMDYRRDQLLSIADSPDHVFGVDNGFKGLQDIVEPLTAKSCIEITNLEPSTFCAGQNYELMVSGRGFNNARNPEEVICRFIFTDKKFYDKKAITMDDTTVMCPGVTIDNPDEAVLVEVSLNNGINFIKSNANITSKNCVTARPPALAQASAGELGAPPYIPAGHCVLQGPASEWGQQGHLWLRAARVPQGPAQPPGALCSLQDVPVEVPTVIPPIPTPHIDLPTPPATSNMPNVNPLCLALLLLALLLLPFLIWCCWRHCCKKPCKELPAVQIIQREPMGRCVPPPCPTFIVPCACQGGGMRRIEGKLDTLCDFVQCCNQMPLLWCQPRSKRRCFNFSLQPCRRLPCGPRICLPAPQECFPLSSCCSRYQPAPHAASTAAPLRGLGGPGRRRPQPRCGTSGEPLRVRTERELEPRRARAKGGCWVPLPVGSCGRADRGRDQDLTEARRIHGGRRQPRPRGRGNKARRCLLVPEPTGAARPAP
ncbi:anthrax toxin receptor-like [Vulpes lagopus]|uniref:anthrax toxin receptor-like n=1 Tax=Vulpes lagopus TaxID=494514 RepID=UPI001BC9F183|nr:anthrax toxin receptor-like [Vulpes lagopus]